jgi:hypothetical protein
MKFINNLGATFEERVFAEMELRRIGDFAVPFMAHELRVTRNRDVYTGILGAIKQLEATTIGGWVAALDGLSPVQQYGVVNAIASRPDVLNLTGFAQSDMTPFLWRVMAQPKDESPTLRAQAEDLLGRLRPGSKPAGRLPEAELVALARTFYDHTRTGRPPSPCGCGTPPTRPTPGWSSWRTCPSAGPRSTSGCATPGGRWSASPTTSRPRG